MTTTDDTRIPLTSADVAADRLAALRDLYPEAFTEGKVDIDALKAALGEAVATGPERYGLSWAGKAEAMRHARTLSTATLRPAPDESVRWDETENLIIEGDNLEVLKLLQKSYHGRVKMIYIDPPYNTGKEFIYPDNFREGLNGYLRYTGQVGDNGARLSTNTETDGRFHSKWLSMMAPRLTLARNLLRDDGVIFVSIDDNEVHNLRLLMNEVFGEENLLVQFTWKTDGNFDNQARFKRTHEYIVVYAKRQEAFPAPPVIDPSVPSGSKLHRSEIRNTIVKNGPKNPVSTVSLPAGFPADFTEGTIGQRENLWPHYLDTATVSNGILESPIRIRSGWSSRELLQEFIDNNCLPITDSRGQLTRFVISSSGAIESIKDRTEGHSHVISSLSGFGGPQRATAEIEHLGVPFSDYPKPTDLIRYFVRMNVGDDFIVMDFFAGSGTTAHAVLDLNKEDGGNRKFILVQLPERTGNPDYPTIADICKERVRRVIARMDEQDSGKLPLDGGATQDRGFRVYKLDKSNFKLWDAEAAAGADPAALAGQLRLHVEHIRDGRTDADLLAELLLTLGIKLTEKVTPTTISGHTVYRVGEGGLLAICLERDIDAETLRGMADAGATRIMCLDHAFAGNDMLKTNIRLEMEARGVTFRTV